MPRSSLTIVLSVVCICSLGLGSASAAIVINEIMYNSIGTPDIEWIELYNDADTAVDLTGWYLLDSDPTHEPCYLVGLLGGHEYLCTKRIAATGSTYTHQRQVIDTSRPEGQLSDPSS